MFTSAKSEPELRITLTDDEDETSSSVSGSFSRKPQKADSFKERYVKIIEDFSDMNLSHHLTTFFILMLSIIGICEVQQKEYEKPPPPVLASMTANVTLTSPQGKENEKPCPSNVECSELPAHCLNCDLSESCIYGRSYNITCTANSGVQCIGKRELVKTMICRYCYQTDHWEHTCIQKANCNSVASPRAYYRTNCSVKDSVICLGKRKFNKNLPCNWTGGYRWSTALALSITLGGFGADRFYLGHWQEGIGKLFSFGGLGVWTLIDVILIALHYLGPADGSLYL